jgi:15-cis-phytoene synthase
MTAPRHDTASALDASTFSVGFGLLPPDLKTDAIMLYKVLRLIDDLVDERDPCAPQRVAAIEQWADHHSTDTPETRTLTALSQRHQLPRHALSEFCAGMRHDLAQTKIETEDDLERYCQYVGGSIGAILANMLNATHNAEKGMTVLGRAAQRTNILRDIDEDHANSRHYIARTTIERFGSPAPGAREALLRDQIKRADQLYDQGLHAIPYLPRGRRAIALSAALYREILRQIERDGFGRTPGRTIVPAWRTRLLTAQYRLKPTSAFSRPRTAKR